MTGPALETLGLAWPDPETVRVDAPGSPAFNPLSLAHIQARHTLDHQLPRRFAQVTREAPLTVAQDDFGLGLSFLACWQSWLEHRPNFDCQLHFIAHQPHPLTRDNLQRALALWPQLAVLSAQLTGAWPAAIAGVHRLVLGGGQVRLTLHMGNQGAAWSDLVRQAHYRLDHDDNDSALASLNRPASASRLSSAPVTTSENPITIIGAGIAGACLARNLADRGMHVRLLDTLAPGQAASGNQQGALYAKLGVDYSPQTALALSALLFAGRFYKQFQAQSDVAREPRFFHPTGLLQLAFNAQEERRQSKFLQRNDYPLEVVGAVTAQQASSLVGVDIKHNGLWFPGGGWLIPSQLCLALANHPLIFLHTYCTVDSIASNPEQWQLSATHRPPETGNATTLNFTASRLVICTGAQTPGVIPDEWFAQGARLRLKPIRGQVSHLPAEAITPPRAVICGSRYLNPVYQGVAVTGATFDLRDANPLTTTTSHRENLHELNAQLPGVIDTEHPAMAPENLAGRVAFRCTTHDYQPVAGAIDPAGTRSAARAWMFTGLGSKGLTYAPLLAEYLADVITAQPAAIPAELAHRLRVERVLAVPFAQENASVHPRQ